jgi:hypothetical protein
VGALESAQNFGLVYVVFTGVLWHYSIIFEFLGFFGTLVIRRKNENCVLMNG